MKSASLHSLYLIPFLAFAGLVIVFLYQKYGGKSSKGMTLIFEVGHGVENHIPKRLIPLVIVTTWLTHLFGGSAGREGVAVQLGATVSHWFCKNFSIPNTSKVFLVTGMAAGFAGLFQTPLAAVLFAMEVLVVGNLQLTALYPAMIASLVASWTSHALGLEKFVQPISVHLVLSPTLVIKLVLLGVLIWTLRQCICLCSLVEQKESGNYFSKSLQTNCGYGNCFKYRLFTVG